jgi:protein transport protein SEC61 subunit gamma-like protein
MDRFLNLGFCESNVMDINQGSTEKPDECPQVEEAKPEEKKPELKLPIDISKFKMKPFRMPEGGVLVWIKNKINEYRRVLAITKKPDNEEYKAIVKASGLGIIVIGMLGFIITMIIQVIMMFT